MTITFNLIKNNREKMFRQCVESVHSQTYKNIEHIIIDGGSKDGTVELVKEYFERGWVKFVSESDTGIYDAMNKGVKMANGKYVAFLNSDDFYNSIYGIEMSVNALEKKRACFSYAPVVNLDPISNKQYIHTSDISSIFFSLVPNHQTMFFRRDIIIKEGLFDTKYKCVGDYDLNIRLCLKGYKHSYIDSAFSTYRLGGYSLEAFKNGIISEEVSNIYYENYNKLCLLTREDCKKMCGNVFHADPTKVPFKLAKKLECKSPYFNFSQYLKLIGHNNTCWSEVIKKCLYSILGPSLIRSIRWSFHFLRHKRLKK